MSEVCRGCLALADISGYTSYLAGVELEHSHDVLADLLGVVAGELGAVGALAKLEGDAVFVCDPAGSTSGEQLLAALDASYGSFMRRRRTIALRTTCACDACARIPTLDLKFAVHHGEFIEHVVAGREEVVGSDVVLVHRLLKNDVPAALGTSAYALLTAAAVERLGLDARSLDLAPHSERFEGVGEVAGWVCDMGARWEAASEREPVEVRSEDAAIDLAQRCEAPRHAVWEALVDPAMQMRWRSGASAVENVAGPERGVGARTHCVHGSQTFDQEILDWRPFDYFTYRERGPFGPFLWTFALADDGEGTLVHTRIRLAGGRGQRVVMLAGRSRMRKIVRSNLAALARETAGGGAAAGSPAAAAREAAPGAGP